MEKSMFTVAIVGGGIAGLAFALALSKSRGDITIDIYEAATNFSELGAGLGLWPRVLEVLHSFGLTEALRAYAGSAGHENKLQFRKADESNGIAWGETPASIHTIHRAELLQILVEHTASRCRHHFSKKIESYEDVPNNPVTLKFSDGSTAVCDLLVGADGVKSAIRAHMYNQMADKLQSEGRPEEEVRNMVKHVKPTWSGCLIYRNLIAKEDLEKLSPDHVALDRPVLFQGRSQNVVAYPISQGRWINVGCTVARHDFYGTMYDGPWVVRAPNEELATHYVGWEKPVQDIVKLMGDSTRWVVNIVGDLPTFVSGRVALIGDAAHSMTPYQAAGAMQAIEDGCILSTLLSQPDTTPEAIPLVLQIYDEVRRPLAQEVQRLSLHTGQTILLEKMEGVTRESSAAGLVPKERLLDLGNQLNDLYGWTWSTSALQDRDRALEIYRAKVRGSNLEANDKHRSAFVPELMNFHSNISLPVF